MLHTLLNAFDVAQYITHPISLLAYFAAAIMTYFIARNVNDRKKLQSVREEDRAAVIIKTAEKLHLDINSVPQNERSKLISRVLTNRIISQVIVAIVILIIGLLIAWLISKRMDKPPVENRTQQTFDSAAYRKAQSSFTVQGIQLEGNAIDMLIDSNRIAEDWERWLKSKSKILFSVTSVFDTLLQFKKRFSHEFDPYYQDGTDHRTFSVLRNDEPLRKVRKPASLNRLSGTDPNAEYEYTFSTSLDNAVNVFGFSRACFENYSSDDTTPYSERVPPEDCATHLSSKGLEFLKSGRYKQKDVDNDFESPIIHPTTEDFLRIYLHVGRKRLPPKFILLQSYSNGACLYGRAPVTIFYSTPLMKVSCIVIKNIFNEPITITNLKMIFTKSDSLRTKQEDLSFSRRTEALRTPIKIEPNTDIVIPTSISFTPLNKIKPNDGDVDPYTNLESFYYGEVCYLDSLGIDGFNFAIQQIENRDVITAFFDGKTYQEFGSCPYAYSYSTMQSNFVLENHILYNLNSESKENFDTLLLKNPSSKILLYEVDPEDSYIDELIIMQRTVQGKITLYRALNDTLRKRDKVYQHLKTSDRLLVEFDPFVNYNPTDKFYLISYGYYKPKRSSQKYRKPPETLDSIQLNN